MRDSSAAIPAPGASCASPAAALRNWTRLAATVVMLLFSASSSRRIAATPSETPFSSASVMPIVYASIMSAADQSGTERLRHDGADRFGEFGRQRGCGGGEEWPWWDVAGAEFLVHRNLIGGADRRAARIHAETDAVVQRASPPPGRCVIAARRIGQRLTDRFAEMRSSLF
jgi:hypothetical protein